MFSATWKPEIQKIAEDYCPNSVKVNIGKFDISANENVEQKFIPYQVEEDRYSKFLKLIKELEEEKSKTLVFCGTKHQAKKLNQKLQEAKFKSSEIHGNVNQTKRDAALSDFKSGKVMFMIATDVASRGIDVSDINTVINYEFPKEDIESYVHRIGRTARAGKKGTSITFLNDNEDFDMMSELIKILKKDNIEIPSCLQYYLDLTKKQIQDLKNSQKLERKKKNQEKMENIKRRRENMKKKK